MSGVVVASEARGLGAAELGGKGANLVRLRELGFEVPAFVVVTASAFEAAGVRAAGGCPAALVGEVEAALARAGVAWPVAVRSSAVDEDGAAHSFAGILESVLEVGRDGLASALSSVWASAFAPRAEAYRRRKGLGGAGVRAAVVVQEMVPARSAGVLFTRDPAAADDVVVVATRGLGVAVVQGTGEASTYRLGRGARRVRREAGASVLGDRQVRALRAAGLRVEEALGAPQDVEWAFDGGGKLWLLQARPIVPAGRASAPRRVWDNSNIVESYPGLTLPLTFSFARRAYEDAFRAAARSFFPVADPFRARPHLFKSLIGLVRGRVYYNLLDWYELFSCFADPAAHRQVWDRMVGVSSASRPAAAAVPPLWLRALAGARAATVLLGVQGSGERFFRQFSAFLQRHGSLPGGQSAAELAQRYHALAAEAGSFWHLTLFNDLCAMRYHAWLAALVERARPGRPALVNALLAGEDGLESVAPLRSLAALGEQLAADAELRALFAAEDDDGVWRALHAEPRFAAFRALLERHLAAYGDRGVMELKLETATFREEPARLLSLLRPAAGGRSLAAREERERERRREAEAEVRAGLGAAERLAFAFVLSRARLAVRNRENMRFARSRLFGVVRRLFRELGSQLAAAGALAAPADVFYLTVEEVLGYAEGTAVSTDLRGLVALRRREYEAHARWEPADRLETEGFPGLQVASRVAAPAPAGPRLRGTGCSAGVVTGRARVVADPCRAEVRPGDVLVARSTDPGWVFLMMSAAGLVAERGSLLSHTAIIGRELGIPTVVGVPAATERIPDGVTLTLDGGSGEVLWA